MKIRRNKTGISDYLKEVSMHMIQYVDDPDEICDLLKFASLAWNLTFLDESELPNGPRSKIQEMLRVFRQEQPWLSDIEVLELEDQMMIVYQLKKEKFPNVPNFIHDVLVRREGNMNYIKVLSIYTGR